MGCYDNFWHFSTRKYVFNICWPHNQQLLKIIKKSDEKLLKIPKNYGIFQWPEMQSATFFISKNVLLAQENILDIANVTIGTIDPSTKIKKVHSKKFFSQKNFFFQKFSWKSWKLWKMTKNQKIFKWSKM